MFEAWEKDIGHDDVDLGALTHAAYAPRARTSATLRWTCSHTSARWQLRYSPRPVSSYASRLLVICDNPFMPYLQDGLERSGATAGSVAG